MSNGSKAIEYQTIGREIEITPIKYKTVLRIGPFRNAGYANPALHKVKALLKLAELKAVKDYKIGHDRTDQFYITVGLAENREDDGVETLLAMLYAEYKKQIIG